MQKDVHYQYRVGLYDENEFAALVDEMQLELAPDGCLSDAIRGD